MYAFSQMNRILHFYTVHINAKDSVSEYLCPESVQIIEVQMLLNMS